MEQPDGTTTLAARQTGIADRLDIIDTCTRLAWHADRREWDTLRSVFADTVLLDYTSLHGGQPTRLTPDQIVDAWAQGLGGFDATHHLIANHLVTVDGDTAVCTAAFQATHRLATALGGSLWTLGGTYHFDLARFANGWLITGLVMTATWGDGNKDLTGQAAAR